MLQSSALGIVVRVDGTVKWRAITEGANVVCIARYQRRAANEKDNQFWRVLRAKIWFIRMLGSFLTVSIQLQSTIQ